MMIWQFLGLWLCVILAMAAIAMWLTWPDKTCRDDGSNVCVEHGFPLPCRFGNQGGPKA